VRLGMLFFFFSKGVDDPVFKLISTTKQLANTLQTLRN